MGYRLVCAALNRETSARLRRQAQAAGADISVAGEDALQSLRGELELDAVTASFVTKCVSTTNVLVH